LGGPGCFDPEHLQQPGQRPDQRHAGRLLVGTSSASSSQIFAVQGRVTDANGYANIGLRRGSAPTSGNPTLGVINFCDNNENAAAYIAAGLDPGTWTPGSSHPGHLAFATTADGASSPTERFRISSTGAQSSVIPGGSTLYPQFACRAWVNFNGTGTVAIRASGNVSSITDNGTGDYTVNLTTAAADTNYAAFAHTSRNPVSASTGDRLALVDMTLSSAAAIRCFCTTSDTSSNSVLIDQSYVTVSIFR
jgi:hypothetical protein